MEKFFNKILVLILSLAVTCLILFAVTKQTGTDLPPSEFYFVNELRRIYTHGDADVIILGNSKALSSLSSQVITSVTGLTAYNLAISSADLLTSKLTVETYLKNCTVPPRYCFLEVSWFSFNGMRTELKSSFAADLAFNDLQPMYYCYVYPAILQKMVLKSEAGMISSLNKLTDYALMPEVSPQKKYLDYSLKFTSSASGAVFDRKEMLKIFPNQKAGISSLLYSALGDIARLCIANNVQLILYTAPELPEYTREQLDKEVVKQRIRAVAAKYHARYLDFTVDGNYWDPAFVGELTDSHHLNNPVHFTRYFVRTALQSAK